MVWRAWLGDRNRTRVRLVGSMIFYNPETDELIYVTKSKCYFKEMEFFRVDRMSDGRQARGVDLVVALGRFNYFYMGKI